MNLADLDPETLRAAADVADSEAVKLRGLMDKHMHSYGDGGALAAYKHVRRLLRTKATRVETKRRKGAA